MQGITGQHAGQQLPDIDGAAAAIRFMRAAAPRPRGPAIARDVPPTLVSRRFAPASSAAPAPSHRDGVSASLFFGRLAASGTRQQLLSGLWPCFTTPPAMFRLRRGSRDRSKGLDSEGGAAPAVAAPADALLEPSAPAEGANGQSHINRLARTFNPLGFHTTSTAPGSSQQQPPPQHHPHPRHHHHHIFHSDDQDYRHNAEGAAPDSPVLPVLPVEAMQRSTDRGDPKHWSMPSTMDSPALGTDAPVIAQQGAPAKSAGAGGSGGRAVSSGRGAVPVSSAAGAAAGADDGGLERTPDVLTRAFNEALLPYQERIRRLEHDLARAQQNVQVLETEKAALHNWIDRRGLRPDLPPDLSSYFAASPVAAGTLAAQLERKMTMVNYSLHQLGDVLPHPPPASTVTSALSALLPTIHQLAALPGGPAGAFEALIKLAGNLNSHGTGDETDADRLAIAAFYAQLDDAMVRVVGLRATAADDGHEDWDLSRDLERLQRTAAFLEREMGVRNYFVRAQEAMRGEPVGPSASASAAAAAAAANPSSSSAPGGGGGGRNARSHGTRIVSSGAQHLGGSGQAGGGDSGGRYSGDER